MILLQKCLGYNCIIATMQQCLENTSHRFVRFDICLTPSLIAFYFASPANLSVKLLPVDTHDLCSNCTSTTLFTQTKHYHFFILVIIIECEHS